MNKKAYIWNFLEDLRNNNAKEWMDENRDRYTTARGYWTEEVEAILQRLATHDAYFENFEAKRIMQRINNNRMFHPDKPIYKGYFSASPSGKTDMITKVFVAMGPEFTMIGGGIYRPDSKALKSIREAIDYDAQELLDIVNELEFIKITGGLADDPTKLKSSPRGYDNDHPHVELLRYKSFTAQYSPTKEEITNCDLATEVERIYLALRPLVSWLERAISV